MLVKCFAKENGILAHLRKTNFSHKVEEVVDIVGMTKVQFGCLHCS